jgi:DNA-binding NarL/FixJ family response regulator
VTGDAGRKQYSAGATRSDRPRLFIADRSTSVIDRLAELLSDVATITGWATTAHDTLLNMRHCEPHIAVLDVAMAYGVEVLVQIKQRVPALVVAVLTHSVDDTPRCRCLQLGADHFLDKLHETGKLRQIVGAIGDNQRAADVNDRIDANGRLT